MATIGVDVTALSVSASGGIGSSQYETMRSLEALGSAHRFIAYAATPPVVPFTQRPLDIDWPVRLGSGPVARSNILWMQTGINRLLREDGVDLFWSPRHLLPLRAPGGVALVATIQDFWHLYHPEHQPLVNRTLNRILIERILKRADRIVTTSSAVADDAFNQYGVTRERLTVVPLGVDTSRFTPAPDSVRTETLSRLGLEAPFVLAMDVYNPRKNFARVLEAFAALPASAQGGLSVVGLGKPRASAQHAAPAEVAARLGIAQRVRILDDVAAEDLVALYSSALAFVYPSVYEGFGMPVLEAMACGCPVIAADRSSLPEVAGGAALLVDPDSTASIAEAIQIVLAEPAERDRLIRAGLIRAEAATWRKTAEGMLRVFDDVLAARKARS